ncbi:hypothetical protein Syn7502_01965 [Synechococcus sp. PCC 7502]|uniref:hypothetical protein n=1 Tax=Synechococcus sp. PCC 7502 TaxID=1173263 RepID=UPI00029FB39E|nr:hypothetical protein [Synechococcus sp. PCC 7502]AFY73995.1 hypothetical protein Syn7502_01965 [Synechococcus sp. PCC 7502]
MTEPINSDSTEKLQELLETIASGINKTEEILARSLQVEAEVSQHREAILAAVQEIGGQETINALQQKLEDAKASVGSDLNPQIEERLQTLEAEFKSVEGSVAQFQKDTKLVSQLTLHTERKAYEVVEVQADIEQIASVVGSTVGELGGLDALEALQKEHKTLLSTLEEVKAQSYQFAQLQSEARHIDEKLTLIQERLQAVNNLVTGVQPELGQSAVALVSGDVQQIINRVTQELRQEQQAIDNEHRQKIRNLERKQQSLISLILGGVGVAVVLLLVILVIVATKK